MNVDFGKTATDYRQYRHGFPDEFFKRLKNLGLTNKRALDIGTGTGTVARGLAGNGCIVNAIDIAAAMLAEAKNIDSELGYNIEYSVGSAENTGQADASFDLITAGQCWHWFDGQKALAEIKRIIKPDGRLVIAHYDWIPLKDNIAVMTEELILKYNPNWKLGGGNGFYPQWIDQLYAAGFSDIETFSFDVMASYSHEAWRGRIRASAGVSASNLTPKQVTQFDMEHKQQLLEYFPEEILKALHRCFAIIATPPANV